MAFIEIKDRKQYNVDNWLSIHSKYKKYEILTENIIFLIIRQIYNLLLKSEIANKNPQIIQSLIFLFDDSYEWLTLNSVIHNQEIQFLCRPSDQISIQRPLFGRKDENRFKKLQNNLYNCLKGTINWQNNCEH